MKIHFNIIFQFTLGLLKCSLSLRSLHQNPVRISPVSHKCHTPSLSHSSWFGHRSNTWWRLEIKTFPTMQSSTRPLYLVPVATKRLSQHPFLQHSQPTFLPQYERPSSPPTKKKPWEYLKILLTLSRLTTHIGGRTASLISKHCILYIYSTNIGTEYFKHGIYSLFFLSSKCSLFHNSDVFGSCIIHILYRGCAKIKKK